MSENIKTRFEYTKDKILELILKDLNEQLNTNLTNQDIRVLENNSGDIMICRQDIETIPAPPHYETTNPPEILEMLNWSKDYQQMIEIVYCKRRRNQEEERTARIVTVAQIQGDYADTICYVTLRNGRLEYHELEDNARRFVIPNIERVRLTNV